MSFNTGAFPKYVAAVSFMFIALRLKGVKDADGTSLYALYVKVLNAADHGLPQSRQRVFIIGLQRKLIKSPFKWPKVQKKVPFQRILQKNIVGGRRSLVYIISRFNLRSQLLIDDPLGSLGIDKANLPKKSKNHLKTIYSQMYAEMDVPSWTMLCLRVFLQACESTG